MLKPTVHHSAAIAIDGIAVLAVQQERDSARCQTVTGGCSRARFVGPQDGHEDQADDRDGQHVGQVVQRPEDTAAGQCAVEDERQAKPRRDQCGRRQSREQQGVRERLPEQPVLQDALVVLAGRRTMPVPMVSQ